MGKQLDISRVELLAMEKCWGTAELQRRAGLANQTLYKIRKGENRASARTVGKIARALGVKPEEILREV